MYFLLAAVLSDRAAPLAKVLSVRASPLSNIFSDGASQQNVWWKVESREFVFSIRKSIGKSIRKSDSTTRSVRPILWTQAAADAVHMYTSTAFSICPPICTHCTSKSQPPYNHRTIYHASTAQASHAQCADKMQALCKHRTLNVPPKCKHRASIARSICRQSASTAQASHAQCSAKAQALCKHRTLNVPPKCKLRAISHAQCAAKVQTTPFLPTFLCLSLKNLPFHPSYCSRRSQNG